MLEFSVLRANLAKQDMIAFSPSFCQRAAGLCLFIMRPGINLQSYASTARLTMARGIAMNGRKICSFAALLIVLASAGMMFVSPNLWFAVLFGFTIPALIMLRVPYLFLREEDSRDCRRVGRLMLLFVLIALLISGKDCVDYLVHPDEPGFLMILRNNGILVFSPCIATLINVGIGVWRYCFVKQRSAPLRALFPTRTACCCALLTGAEILSCAVMAAELGKTNFISIIVQGMFRSTLPILIWTLTCADDEGSKRTAEWLIKPVSIVALTCIILPCFPYSPSTDLIVTFDVELQLLALAIVSVSPPRQTH